MIRLSKRLLLIVLLCCSLAYGTALMAAESAGKDAVSSYVAVTAKDPHIPVGQLQFLLMSRLCQVDGQSSIMPG
jgi:hypothetical protein